MSTGNGSGDEDGDGRKGKTREVRYALRCSEKVKSQRWLILAIAIQEVNNPVEITVFCMREFMAGSRLVKKKSSRWPSCLITSYGIHPEGHLLT